MRFGISTHLYHDRRLSRDHLADIAAHGFEAVEVFATRSHFDYHDLAAIATLEAWLGETGLALHAIHAPIAAAYRNGLAGSFFSTASSNEERRAAAVREADAALGIARRIPTSLLVVHLGVPEGRSEARDNDRAAAIRSLEEIHQLADPVGVRVAAEVIPNPISSAAALAHLLDEEMDLRDGGICLDFGHAFLMGDLVDAIEQTSGYLVTTHVHDNHGRLDDHLIPFDGAIDWPPALTALQKIGYDGTLLLELANTGTPGAVLGKAQRSRERFERILRTEISR